MPPFTQPSVFISHGTMYEAFKSSELKADFAALRAQHFPTLPAAIVLFSGHWQTDVVAVTTSPRLAQLDEGFPPEFRSAYQAPGHPALAHRIIDLITAAGIAARPEPHRGLDHGALIPLLLLFPHDPIPVVQLSQQAALDPVFHLRLAAALAPLRHENILFVGSGGLVHNREEIVRFGGHALAPDNWAKAFDDFIAAELADPTDRNYPAKLLSAYQHPLFARAHPTSEHFLPLVFASGLGGQPTSIYDGFQWKNLSLRAYQFAGA